MIDQLGLTAPAPLSTITLLVNLAVGTVVSFILSWHYVRFGRTLSNRNELAHVFPIVTLVTLLIISVVKSSLALSLGLVGALSIVRFRTPIKEPEELAYLFLAISIGLGFGADQRTPTLIASIVILGVIAIRTWRFQNKEKNNLYMNIEVSRNENDENMFNKINGILTEHVLTANMRRLDVSNGSLQATYYIDCEDNESLTALMDNLNKDLPEAAISFVEQKGIPGS